MDNTLVHGLTTAQAKSLQAEHGKNELQPQKKENIIHKIIHIITEPMFLLLLIAAFIYFLLGEPRDGLIMLVFVVGIISIDVIQEWKTDKTLSALKDLSAPHIKVIRDGNETVIASADLVPGDLMKLYEGVKIPADGYVLRCNDLCVDESSLTGEAEGVWKVSRESVSQITSAEQADYWKKDYCYAGTLVTQGTAVVVVEKIGLSTEYGKIGRNVASAPDEPTPLQKQTGHLVKLCAGIAAVLSLLVAIFTYINIPDHENMDRIVESILAGITLAMAMIPEEFPVILTVFLSMGAWRLARKHSLVRKLPSVETLGAISVLCVDKTGTITLNRMTVEDVRALDGDKRRLTQIMGMGCETDAYDPMEKAMLSYCEGKGLSKDELFGGELVKEYAFTNELKMMGHVWQHDSVITVAVKGSPERVLGICGVSDIERKALEQTVSDMSSEGLRVIAVATADITDVSELPDEITGLTLVPLGFVGLADPPRESVKKDIEICNKAGIRVVMITGDNGITASSIARKIGMPHSDHIITGDMLNEMTDEELREHVKDVSIFSRVVPEHKMRIVKAFKDNGEIVGMTGDGVNDAPALKYADIGIAMGKRGSDVSREAADLILLDDNFTTIVETVKDGRRIYDNIRKAVGYVFTIHIPIALASLLAPMIGIPPGALLLLPLHVVLLELIIDPTCSIVLERQPAESDIMDRPPRNPKEPMLSTRLLAKSVLQGLVIFAASFGIYLFNLYGNGGDLLSNAAIARSMSLAVLMISNLLLVQVNSSDHDYAYRSVKRLARDKVMWAVNIVTIIGLALILYSPINGFLKLSPLSASQALSAVVIAVIAVLWYEVVKLVKKMRILN